MSKSIRFLFLTFLLVNLSLAGCSGGGGGGGGSPDTSGGTSQNHAPSVTTAASATVNAGETVVLTAYGSDPDGDDIRFHWVQTAGQRVVLDDAGAATATFLAPPVAGTLSFRVDVSDGITTASSETLSIDVVDYTGDSVAFTQNPFMEHASLADAEALKIVNDKAYVAAGADGMVIYDITTETPAKLGSYTPGSFTALHLSVASNRAAVYGLSTNHAVRLIDVSTATNPIYLGEVLTGALIVRDVRLSDDGNTLYLGTDMGLRIYDITNPANPVALTLDPAFTFSDEILAMALVETSGSKTLYTLSRAYSTATIGNLNIFDVTTPTTSLATLGTLTNLPVLERMQLVGTTLYATGVNGGGLNIIDVSTTASPLLIGGWQDSGWTMRSVQVQDNKAYIADWFRGVAVVDVTDPSQVTLIGEYDTPGRAFTLALNGTKVYVADNEVGLQVIDASVLSLPQAVSSLGTTVSGRAVAAKDGRAFLIDDGTSSESVVAYDISDPTAPAILGTYSSASYNRPNAIALYDRYALVAGSTGLEVLDVTDPAAMQLVDEYPTPSISLDFTSVAAAQGYAYVGTDSSPGSLRTYDISNPADVKLVDQDQINDYYAISGLAIDGSTIQIASMGGLHSADISDPAAPVMVNNGSSLLYGTMRDIDVVAGTTLLAQSSYLGDFITSVDTSDPATASQLGQYGMSAYGIAVAGRYLYATEYQEYSVSTDIRPSLYVLDMANPATPTLSGFYELPDIGRDLAVYDGHIYIATKTRGMAMMQAEPQLANRYTNGTVGGSLSYTVSWDAFPSSVDTEVKCVVTGGSCAVSGIDQTTRTASVSWTMPLVAGDHEIAFVVGDQHAFISTRDRVSVQ